MTALEHIFNNKTPDFNKLQAYGFILKDNGYIYKCDILGGQFKLQTFITGTGNLSTQLIDTATDEEYILHLTGAEGKFVGKIRNEYTEILQNIAEKCFNPQIFKQPYTNEIITYIKNKYNDSPEFLWNKFPEDAIVRRQDNKKWYAVFLTVEKNKLGLTETEKTEILDIRANSEEISEIIDNRKYFRGYHMNKKHWLTICLDGSVSLPEIFSFIDKSYLLAK